MYNPLTDNPLWYLVQKYPDKNWDWHEISRNPNLTVEFVEEHIDDINWSMLSENQFILENVKAITLKNTSKIKEELLNKTWYPDRMVDWCLTEDQKKSISEKFEL